MIYIDNDLFEASDNLTLVIYQTEEERTELYDWCSQHDSGVVLDEKLGITDIAAIASTQAFNMILSNMTAQKNVLLHLIFK